MSETAEAEDFRALAGYEIVEWTDGMAAVEMTVSRRHGNRSGNLHGGMSTSLLDVACARAVSWAPDGAPKRYVSTVSLTVNFLKSVNAGRVRAVGRLQAGGSRLVTCRGELRDEAGDLVAVCQGVFRRREGRG